MFFIKKCLNKLGIVHNRDMKFFKLLLLTTCFLCVCACSSKVDLAFERKLERKIGVILPLSNSRVATDIADGIALALAEFNSSHKQSDKFEFYFEDINAKNPPLKAVSNLSEKGVRVFCVGFDKEIIKVHKLFSGMSGAFFNFMMNYPPATVQGTNSTRMFFNIAQEADMLAECALKKDGEKTFVILSEDSSAGKSAGDFLNFSISASDRKVFRDFFTKGETRFDIFASQIITQKPRAIFYIGDGYEFPYLEKSLKQNGYKGLLYRNRGMDLSVRPSPHSKCSISLFEKCLSFSEKFKQTFFHKFSRKPSVFAAWGYDSANLLITAMISSDFQVSKMRDQFCNVQKQGVVGNLKFDSSADCTVDLILE